MGNVSFGQLVRDLREEKEFFDEVDGRKRFWSRERLSTETGFGIDNHGLSVAQIMHIERGEVENLKPKVHLEPLCRAFGLTEAEKVEFYSVAGYVYCPNRNHDEQLIRRFLRQYDFPAHVVTPLFDLRACNSHYLRVHSLSEKHIDLIKENPNLVYHFFAEEFNRVECRGGREKWERAVRDFLRAFRLFSFRHKTTERYKEIINQLKAFADFDVFWKLSTTVSIEADRDMLIDPFIKIYVSGFQEVTFLPLHLSPLYHGSDDVLSVYVPVAQSLERYQTYCLTGTENEIYFFG